MSDCSCIVPLVLSNVMNNVMQNIWGLHETNDYLTRFVYRMLEKDMTHFIREN